MFVSDRIVAALKQAGAFNVNVMRLDDAELEALAARRADARIVVTHLVD